MRFASCGYCVSRNASAKITRALEIAKGGATPRIDQRLDGGVRVLRRVTDLRDVVHRGDAVVELAKPTEQLVDVDVLRSVHGSEFVQDEFVVSRAPARRARPIIDEHTIGEKAAQRRLELVMVRIDEAGHHNLAARIDVSAAAGVQVRSDGKNLLTLDQHVGPGEAPYNFVLGPTFGSIVITDTAADDVAPAGTSRYLGAHRLRRSGTRRE